MKLSCVGSWGALFVGCAGVLLVLAVKGRAGEPQTQPGQTAGAFGAADVASPVEPDAGVRRTDLVWDLSESRDTAVIDWPAAVRDDKWFIDGPRSVTLVLPGGRRATYRVADVMVRREGGRVAAIALGFPNESFEAAYARAGALAKEWDIPEQQKLDQWREDIIRRGLTPTGLACDLVERKGGGKVRVRVGPAFRPDAPWWVQLSVGFLEAQPERPSAPTSQASAGEGQADGPDGRTTERPQGTPDQ